MFRGLENGGTVLHDPVLPLHDPGMKLCVNVLAMGRPNYLYLCLDGIFRNSVFAEGSANVPDVFIYVDIMPNGDSYAKEILQVAADFPVSGVFINDKCKGTVNNYWESFEKAFDDGYDFCVLIEEDWLITSEALQWLYDVPKIASHYSLYRWTDRMDGSMLDQYGELCRDGEGYTLFKDGVFLSWCLAFPKDSFTFIHNIIKAGQWGLYNHDIQLPEIRRTGLYDWDKTLKIIFALYRLQSMVPAKSHLLHFGSKSTIAGGFGSGGLRHDEIFKGEPNQWLDNFVVLYKSIDEEEKKRLCMYPVDFVYV